MPDIRFITYNAQPAAPRDTNATELAGVLASIKYHQSNFLIGILNDGAAVKGNMLSPQVGLEYKFTGRWERHAKWGDQFAFTEYHATYPTDLDAVRAYLEENCKWVGPKVSLDLIIKYGADTLKICKEAPERVASEINGITRERAAEVSAMLRNNEANEELQLQLKELLAGTRISKRAVNAILEKYGHEAPAVIRKNPFALIEAIDGIGFVTADEIAKRVGYEHAGGPRIQAGILHTLKEQAYSAGHTRVTLAMLLEAAEELLDVLAADILSHVYDLRERKEVVEAGDGWVSLAKLYDDECIVAEKLKLLSRQIVTPGQPVFDKLAVDQRDAVIKACEHGVMVLYGAPGVGKTFTIKRIIESFPEARIALAAPSGKASKRMREQTGRSALTIHKLLEPMSIGGRWVFTRTASNPIEANLIVIDECFVRGTLVDTPSGQRAIELLRPGDEILNASGRDRIVAVAWREARRVAKVTAGEKTFLSSENHPFFTARGVVVAGELKPGDSLLETAAAMRLLRDDYHSEVEGLLEDAILQTGLQSQLVAPVSGVQAEALYGRESQARWREQAEVASVWPSGCTEGDREDTESLSHARQRVGSQEAISDASRDWTPPTGPGRQWQADSDTTGVALSDPWSAVVHGVCRSNRAPSPGWCSDLLQDRHSPSGSIAGARDRRRLAPHTDRSSTRCEEGCVPEWRRVDSVEILEPDDPRLDQFRDASGKLYLYDLQAARHPSFSVNGCLVHNCSMVDTSLFARFLDAVSPRARLILVGDTNQLPSIGPGNILKDLLASGEIASAELTTIKRQDPGLIIRNCHAIRDGLDINAENGTASDFFFFSREGEESIRETIFDLVSRRLPESYKADPLRDIQVIAPLREKGELSCKAMNAIFQARLNKNPAIENIRFKLGDKVIQTKNAYDLDIINGDLGIVTDIDTDARLITVAFENPERCVAINLFKNDLELAYAITAHKFQGSEARIVVIPIHKSFGTLIFQRPWIYTAISRAREVCVLVGQREEVTKAIKRNDPQRRFTGLLDMLSDYSKAD